MSGVVSPVRTGEETGFARSHGALYDPVVISRRSWHRLPGWIVAAGCLLPGVGTTATEPVSFRHEVMAVLSKSGCNAGACHGNASGKGGFKLSLRGEDPDADHDALVRDAFGRRVLPNAPDDSLLLLKAVTRVAHEGGVRFTPESIEYRLLRDWVAAGAGDDASSAPRLVDLTVEPVDAVIVAPLTSARIRVRAHFSDGADRDVGRLAVYEPTSASVTVTHDGEVRSPSAGEVTVVVRYLGEQRPVRLAFVPDRPDVPWPDIQPNNLVDDHVFEKLRRLRIRPSGTVDDARFLRRVSLDLLGLLPTAAEAKAFLADPYPDKRSRVIEAMLRRPEFAEFWALKWSDLLRNEERALDRKGVELFHRWIRDGIAAGKPMDRFVREIVTARGSSYENPPANFYRSLRDVSSRAETVAQVFLGTRLLCAQCHNHPFDRWTQADYHDWSGFFARVNYKVLENRYPDGLDKHAFVGEQIVYAMADGEATHPKSGNVAAPRVLGGTEPIDPGQDRLDALAAWLTAPENPRFARTQVNRIWYHLMGRGLVDPVDDFRATNPPSHPALLEALTERFVSRGFDLREVIRLIANSHAYQADSLPDHTAVEDETNYSHSLPRRLGAEQMLDALSQVAGVSLAFQGYPEGIRAGQIPGVQAVNVRRRGVGSGERFLTIFGKPSRLLASEEERSCQTTLGQTLQLMTGPALVDLLRRPGNRLDALAGSDNSPEAVLDELYWTALSRAPTPEEQDGMRAHLEGSTDRRAALEDIVWALVNAKEFVLRP